MGQFFASLRISASYAVVGAVISEWLGGFNGLGVYMTTVKKAFSFDKMFAVIFLISVISLSSDEAGGSAAEEMHALGTGKIKNREDNGDEKENFGGVLTACMLTSWRRAARSDSRKKDSGSEDLEKDHLRAGLDAQYKPHRSLRGAGEGIF